MHASSRNGWDGRRSGGQEEGTIGGGLTEVSDHSAVDDVGEVSLEDAPRLLLGVSASARVLVERLRPRLAAQLGDGHQVQDPVDPPVAAGVVAMAHRLAGSLRGGGGQRR